MESLFSEFLPLWMGSACGAWSGVSVIRSRELGRGPESLRSRRLYFISGSLATAVAVVSFGLQFGFSSPVPALAVTLMVAAWVALLNTLARLRTPVAIREVSQTELRLLHSPLLDCFGWLVRRTPLGKLGGNVFVRGRRSNLSAVVEGLLDAEAVHFWGAAASLPFLLAWLLMGAYPAFLVSALLILFLHLVPVCHVRLVRSRLERMGRRMTKAARPSPRAAT